VAQAACEPRGGVALLLVDFINPFDFDGAERLLAHALPVARAVRRLCARARAAGVPVIYVNDNFDCWHLGFRELVERFGSAPARGREIAAMLEPDFERDHFVLKPMHSGFFRTPLEVLLQRLGVRRLVLTGVAGESCVLFTANDAYMRGFELSIPADCTASERADDNARALAHMQRVLKADIHVSSRIQLAPRKRSPARAPKTASAPSSGSAPRKRRPRASAAFARSEPQASEDGRPQGRPKIDSPAPVRR
jgi:nicotinamidase-related amidase